ncbi:hypothetical protein PACID_23360 [Acidipropionibacterium acidipropionici ATCC 4875]|uniref:Uncharacterized protein n=1 Tax=Acidipropionibacterium acidipropionici (strain ATCC 4875 / DSM 20272 / JCM 6432 / NBRC 12425 / NCIMB 8070 / 4) TaxID=1171373 RepID=K7SLG7_ACIA4|nr:hypothetical protein PACID_23360 [Acidipropionibacterium acidipropionici ATCC 4875]
MNQSAENARLIPPSTPIVFMGQELEDAARTRTLRVQRLRPTGGVASTRSSKVRTEAAFAA